VLTLDPNFSQLDVEVLFSSLRLALWPFLKAGIITADVENAKSPANTPCD